jgi:CheY-like chemotaxis protein
MKKNSLLIEDNPMNMELATDLLETAGFQVLKAERAEDGIAMAVAQQPDIILMDIALPGMDGLEATRRIKQDDRTARIPIVALTASAMRGDDDRAIRRLLVHCQAGTRRFARPSPRSWKRKGLGGWNGVNGCWWLMMRRRTENCSARSRGYLAWI